MRESEPEGVERRDLRPRDLQGTLDFAAAQARADELARRRQALADEPAPSASFPASTSPAGRVVKGVNFVELRDAGDPVEIAARYDEQGADELTFLDITATSRRARHDPARHRGGGRAGVHSADRGRRRAQRSTTCAACSTPAPTRSASTPPRCRTRSSIGEASGTSTARSASWSPSTPSSAAPAAAGRSTPTAGASHTGLDAVDWARRMAGRGRGRDPAHQHGPRRHQDGFDLALTRAVSRRGAACR